MYEVDAPRKPITHIQNTAPGPPKAMAAATPALLPMPMRPDIDSASARTRTPASELWPVVSQYLTKPRTCMKRVRNEPQACAQHNAISALLQMMLFNQTKGFHGATSPARAGMADTARGSDKITAIRAPPTPDARQRHRGHPGPGSTGGCRIKAEYPQA